MTANPNTEAIQGLRRKLADLDKQKDAIERDRQAILRSIQLVGGSDSIKLSFDIQSEQPERPYDAIRAIIKQIEGPFSLKHVREQLEIQFPKILIGLNRNVITGALYQLCQTKEIVRRPKIGGLTLYEKAK
ncbi:MAG: hypothetical protein EPO07_01715 [Verrucomicrobia bacterium]|nr:MAG: hypothetical protein EPO07_01715 [Verrucomicrobiota bacterium]